MKTREEIMDIFEPLLGVDPLKHKDRAMLDTLLDCRDLLQKLVEKGSKTKVISTTVPMSEKEQALLDAIEL